MKWIVLFFAVLSALHASATIYGKDDRQEIYNSDPKWGDLARSTVAIFTNENLIEVRDGVFTINDYQVYGSFYKLCRDERFYSQPSGAYCSGTLIAENLVLTAGHCFKDPKDDCKEALFLFDYIYENKSTRLTEFYQDKVYRCNKIIKKVFNKGNLDFAVVELDRPVHDRPPIELPNKCQIKQDMPITVVGYPSGLPLKIISNGEVRAVFDQTMSANIDTFSGNSGAPAFNTDTGDLVGMLIGGADDFYRDNLSDCQRVNNCAGKPCLGETLLKIDQVVF